MAKPGASTQPAVSPRLQASARRIVGLEEQLRDERERRDGLIVQSIDEGRSWRSTAADGGVGEATIHRVLARDVGDASPAPSLGP